MRQSLVSASQTRRPGKRRVPAAVSLRVRPLGFLLTGFTWLGVSFLLGIALIIGLIHGTPLPVWLKPMHVHGALVGGILQLAIGGLLLSLDRSSGASVQSRSFLFFALNGVTAGLLFSFWLKNTTVAGLAGLVLVGAVLSLTKPAWIHFGKAFPHTAGAGWMYRFAWAALLAGLAAGAAMAFRLTDGYYAHTRLVHIHLIVLGCFTTASMVTVYLLVPALLRKPSREGRTVRYALWSLPVGFAVLLGAFLMSALWVEIAVGCLLVAGIGLCTVHLIRTWLGAGSPGTAATDHLLIGAFFLVLASAAGLAMGANYLTTPPLLPIGSLHLVAYTHLAFIGFVTHVIFGCLSYVVPDLLAVARIQNHAKQEVYRGQLEAIMNRWRTVQLAGTSLGTMALSVLASLTWSQPLGSLGVQSTVWIAAGLLLASLTLFAAKLAWAVGLRPS